MVSEEIKQRIGIGCGIGCAVGGLALCVLVASQGCPALDSRQADYRQISAESVSIRETVSGILPRNIEVVTLSGEASERERENGLETISYARMEYGTFRHGDHIYMLADDLLGNGLDSICLKDIYNGDKCAVLDPSNPESVKLFAEARKKWDEYCQELDCASADAEWKAKQKQTVEDWFRERM